jgi:hypothetical protein
MPFGLATCAQVLTRLLDREFQDLKFEFVYHYLDDVVVYSENFEEHLEHLKIVLDRLRSAGLTVKPEKVVFATQEISFLCHVISPAGLLIDPHPGHPGFSSAPGREGHEPFCGNDQFLPQVHSPVSGNSSSSQRLTEERREIYVG